MTMMKTTLAVSAIAIMMVANAASADTINASATGLAAPATTITFSEVTVPENDPVTNQYAALGVSFSTGAFSSPQTGFPNNSGAAISNFSFAPVTGGGPFNPITLSFTSLQTGAAFSLNSNNTPFTFTSLLNGVAVESFSANVGLGSLSNYFGFANSSFDGIRIDSGDFFILDNLQLSVAGAVPEPATWAMMIGGIGMVGGAMRRRRVTTTVRFA